MKLVFALDGNGLLGELGDWIKVAIDSARTNTSLDVLVLVDGMTPSFEAWLRQEGIEHLQVRTPLSSVIEGLNRDKGYPLQAKGNYLRYEALRHVEDDYFLYADCDVVFLSDPSGIEKWPALLAACPSDTPFSHASFNSGVLLFNRRAALAELDGFYEYAAANLEGFLPGFDQMALNAFFRDRITALPCSFNWRPHWGATQDISILHFHGVKVEVLEELLSGRLPFSGSKAEQVLDLAARTLTHLPYFMPRIGRPLIERHEILRRLDRLAETAIETVSSPVIAAMKTARTLRADLERETRDIYGERTREFCLKRRWIAPKPIELFPADHPEIRILLRPTSPIIYLSDAMSNDGAIVHPLASGLSINCDFGPRVEIDGRSFTEVRLRHMRKGIDLVFRNGEPSRHSLKMLLLSLAPAEVEFYWGDGGGFSAGRSRFMVIG